MATSTQIRDAMQMLTARAQGVLSAEVQEKRARENHEATVDALREAQDQFDQALQDALEAFPALATGYNLNPETVALGADGQIHVVKEKDL